MFIKTRSSNIPIAYARSIAQTLQTVLIELALGSEPDIRQINLVSNEDRQTIISWLPKQLHSNTNPVHKLVGFTTLSKPDCEAICAWNGSLTYAELDVVSSNVARQLIRAGVVVGDLVPFAFEKSLWAVVATLAILKAGAAFVPLDPGHPKARMEQIMDTVKARLVVTSESFQQLFLNLGKHAIVVSAHTAYTQPADDPNDVTLPSVGPQDPAIVLFTSGSTGQPKGMIHEHGPVASHALTQGKMMGYDRRVFQFSAYTFDMSVHDMFSTLVLGGCICIPSEEDRLNNTAQAMNRMRVEYVFLTPSVASLLRPDDIFTLKILACGGEYYRQEITHHWKDKIQLINLYGLAETGTTHLRFLDHDDSTSHTETVGYPIPTVLCVLVDPENHDRLTPIGAVGELLVAASTLARGYINNEAQNRALFVSNLAWADEMGLKDRRFYKTGDLLRYNVGSFNGKYDWVRRKDTQLKFHGQRMEVAEVEHHMTGIPGVAMSAVVLPERGCFSGQLVAVVQMPSSASTRISKESLCLDPCQTLSIQAVKEHLSKTLPGYMIPTQCLVIGSMPLTPSCKVDRKSVKAWLESMASNPDGSASAAVPIETSPLTEEEITAHSISAAVAEIIASRDKNQGIQFQGRDFLLQSCGIDSIQIISLSIFVQKTYGVRIPMRILFSSTVTVRDLARMIDDKNRPFEDTSDGTHLLTEIDVHASELLSNIKTPASVSQNFGGPSTVRSVFLTGASGYLGSGILRDLLQRPEIEVFALTRSPSLAEGFEQIETRARSHGWWQESYAFRVHVWKGDLTLRHLGLSSEHLQRLRGEKHPCIDTIVHNGAKVHYNQDYQTLKACNVDSTKELLSIVSGASNLSTFIYISGGRLPSAVAMSESTHALQASNTNGYGQSKFVAECLVRKCMNDAAFEAKRLKIIQPGYIIGSPPNGIANQTDFIWRLIAGCVEIGAYDEDEESHWLFISDIDRVSEVATYGLTDPNTIPSCGTAQVLDGLLFSDLWALLRRDFGYALKPLGKACWLQSLEAIIQGEGGSHKLFPLLHTLEAMAGKIGSKEIPSNSVERNDRVKDAVRANVRHLIEVGFLEPPKQGLGASSNDSLNGTNESGETASSGSDDSSTLWERRCNGNASTDKLSSASTSNNEDDKSYGGEKHFALASTTILTMARTRSAANNSSPASSQSQSSANVNSAAGAKRKAGSTAPSPQSKRGRKGAKKEQTTIEETLPAQSTEHASNDTEMKDEPQETSAETGDSSAPAEAKPAEKSKQDEQEVANEKSDEQDKDHAASAGTEQKPDPYKQNGTEAGDTEKKGYAVEESSKREESTPSSILEKGLIYFFFRGRVGIDEPSDVNDIARSYIILRPLPHGAKLGEGPIGDAGHNRMLALPKKVLPVSPKDRFMTFVERANASIEDIKNNLSASDYMTKTAGARHTPAAAPIGEGVYAITSTGRETHLAYILTRPSEISEVQDGVGLRQRGSYVTSAKNPETSAPAGANLPKGAEYPKEILDEFRGRGWMPLTPKLLDYENTQFLIIGHNEGALDKATVPQPDDEKQNKEAPKEELEQLEHEDDLRVEHLKDPEAKTELQGLSEAADYVVDESLVLAGLPSLRPAGV
ncbi:MAG: hypothetical protein Q9181_000568 [Wetmoreana brouardii]